MANYYDNYVTNTLAMGNNTSKQFVNSTQEYYNQTFKESPNYVADATINGSPIDIRVLSMNSKEASNKPDGDYKHILIRNLSYKTNYGDILHFWNKDWIVIDRKISSPASNTCDVVYCNNYLKFKNNQGNIVIHPSFISVMGRMYLDTSNDKELILTKDTYLVKIQKNNDTKQIIESQRFILNNKAFKVMAISDILIEGIIEIKLQSDPIRDANDLVNGIADQNDGLQQPTVPTNLAISGTISPKTNSTTNTYTILNNTVPNTFTWSLVDAISGLATSYGSITSSTTTTCTVSIGANSGKQLKLQATCREDNSVVLSLILTTSAGF